MSTHALPTAIYRDGRLHLTGPADLDDGAEFRLMPIDKAESDGSSDEFAVPSSTSVTGSTGPDVVPPIDTGKENPGQIALEKAMIGHDPDAAPGEPGYRDPSMLFLLQIAAEGHRSGRHDLAERHNEHQP